MTAQTDEAQSVAPIVTITVRGKPVSVNRMYRRSQRGVFLTTEAKEWKAIVQGEAWLAWREDTAHYGDLPIYRKDQQFHIRCTFYGVKGDVDNLLKCTLDGLKDGILIDDKEYSKVESIRGTASDISQGVRIEIWAQG